MKDGVVQNDRDGHLLLLLLLLLPLLLLLLLSYLGTFFTICVHFLSRNQQRQRLAVEEYTETLELDNQQAVREAATICLRPL